MRVLGVAILGVMVAATSIPAAAQISPDELIDAKGRFMSGDYGGAYMQLKHIRAQDYGRSFEVDFILGVSACAMDENRDWGRGMLEWVSYTYRDKLTERGRAVVQDEFVGCRSGHRPSPGRFYNNLVQAGVRMQGKTFYWADSRPAASLSLRSVPPPNAGDAPRAVPRGSVAAAERQGARAMPGGRTHVFSRFAITTSAGHTDRQLRELNDLLERYFGFFTARYGMRAPASYIHVYLVPTLDALNRFAARYHRMQLHYGTIAYSFRDDLSLTAIIPGSQYGSTFHELFHLLARSNFGDIPTWLDEGVAALYEVSQLQGGEARGVPNWRGGVLQQFAADIPSLLDLIKQTAPLDTYASELTLSQADLAAMPRALPPRATSRCGCRRRAGCLRPTPPCKAIPPRRSSMAPSTA